MSRKPITAQSDRDIARQRRAAADFRHALALSRIKEHYPPSTYVKLCKDADPKAYGERVRTVREESNITQEVFSNEIGTSTANLSLIERGKRNGISIDIVYCICAAYHVTPDYLLGKSEQKEEPVSAGHTAKSGPIMLKDQKKISVNTEALYQKLRDATLDDVESWLGGYKTLGAYMLFVLQNDNVNLKRDANKILRHLIQIYYPEESSEADILWE